jgi:hypothetical protein
MRWEKIWRQAADAIRDRKSVPRRAQRKTAPAEREKPVEPTPPSQDLPDLSPAHIAAEMEAPAPPRIEEPPPLVEPEADAFAEPAAEFEPDYADESAPPLAEEAEEPDAAAPPQEVAPPPPYLQPGSVRAVLARKQVEEQAPPAEPALNLVARRLPGIDKPIQMSVQNQGNNRLAFLKKLAKRA